MIRELTALIDPANFSLHHGPDFCSHLDRTAIFHHGNSVQLQLEYYFLLNRQDGKYNRNIIISDMWWRVQIQCLSGLRGLEVTFPLLDPSDAGSNPAEVVEFLRTEIFRERSPPGGALSRLTRVVDLLHVKEPHVPKGNRWAKLVSIFTVQRSWPCHRQRG
jgi:hypothetical protein